LNKQLKKMSKDGIRTSLIGLIAGRDLAEIRPWKKMVGSLLADAVPLEAARTTGRPFD
jgi:hypothetical protein